MAQLKWQNVDAPDLGRAADILNSAAMQVGNGASGIGDAARGIRNDQKARRSAGVAPIVAGVTSAAGVPGALAQIGQLVRPEDMTTEAQEAMMQLQGVALGYDSSRANTAGVRGRESRDASDSARLYAREDQEAAVAGALIERKEGYRNGIIGTESGGNWGATNNEVGSSGRSGHTGRAQFGRDRFDEAKAAGTIPPEMTFEQFGSNTPEAKAAQMRAEDWHFGDLENRLAPYVGAVVNGQTLDMPALVAMGHLGGAGGAIKYVESGGQYNPADSFGTSLSDYAGKHGGGVMVSDLIPENNVLGVDFWDKQSDDAWAQEGEGYDTRRTRAANAATDQAAIDARAGLELALGIAKDTERPEDVNALIAKSGASPAVQAAALEQAQSAVVQNQFGMTTEEMQAALPEAAAAVTSLDVDQKMLNDEKNNDPTLRIQSAASSYSNDPAVALAEKLGMATEDGKGWALDAIDNIIKGAQAEGIRLSPSEAAALAMESTGYAGIGSVLPTGEEWGKTYVNIEDAVELAKNHLSPEQKAAGAERLSLLDRAEQENKSLRDSMAADMKSWQLAGSRGDDQDAARYEKMFSEYADRALSISEGRSYTPKTAPAPTASPEETADTAPVVDPVAAAAEKVVDTVLQQATAGEVDLATLEQQAPEVQVQILETALTNLRANGGAPEQVAVLEDKLAVATYEAQTGQRANAGAQLTASITGGLGKVLGPGNETVQNLANGALMAASGDKVDLERLMRAPSDQQAMVLGQFINTLKTSGGSPEEIEVLQGLLKQAINGKLSNNNRP